MSPDRLLRHLEGLRASLAGVIGNLDLLMDALVTEYEGQFQEPEQIEMMGQPLDPDTIRGKVLGGE